MNLIRCNIHDISLHVEIINNIHIIEFLSSFVTSMMWYLTCVCLFGRSLCFAFISSSLTWFLVFFENIYLNRSRHCKINRRVDERSFWSSELNTYLRLFRSIWTAFPWSLSLIKMYSLQWEMHSQSTEPCIILKSVFLLIHTECNHSELARKTSFLHGTTIDIALYKNTGCHKQQERTATNVNISEA